MNQRLMRTRRLTCLPYAKSCIAAGTLLIACGGETLPLEGREESVKGGQGEQTLRTTEIIGETRGHFSSATFVGDLDLDGFDDFVLLADGGVNDPKDIGTAYLFYGREGFPEHLAASDADLVLHGAHDSVAALGDVDGDGYPDFAFMGNCSNSTCVDTNGLHLVYGGEERYTGEFDSSELGLRWTLEPANALYHQVSAAGDVNNDGYADLLLDVTVDHSPPDSDRAGFLLLGRANREEQIPEGSAFDARFDAGDAADIELLGLRSPGDLDADGHAEVILSTVDYRFSDGEQRAMWLFYGADQPGLTTSDPSVADASFEWMEVDDDSTRYADRVVGLGDLNGDGYAEFGILPVSHDKQAVHVIAGQRQRFVGKHDLSAASWSVATPSGSASQFGSGDIDNDGRLDLVIGDYTDSKRAHHAGVLLSSLALGYEPPGSVRLSEADALVYGRKPPSSADDMLGLVVSTGADTDGDGSDDMLAVAPGNTIGDDEGGRVVLVFGASHD